MLHTVDDNIFCTTMKNSTYFYENTCMHILLHTYLLLVLSSWIIEEQKKRLSYIKIYLQQHVMLPAWSYLLHTWKAWMSVEKTTMSASVILSVTRKVRDSRCASNTCRADRRSCFARSTFWNKSTFIYF